MSNRATSFGSMCLTVLTIVALVAVGFAHRFSQPSPSPAMEAYVAAGGSLSNICGIPGETDTAMVVDCDACRINDTLCAAPRIGPVGSATIQKTYVLGFVAKRIAERVDLDSARLVRAPPQA